MYETRNGNFLNLLYSYNFSPLVNVATEETSNTSSTWFDYIRKLCDHSASNIEVLCNKLGNACDEYFVKCDRSDGYVKCEWLLNKLIFIFSKLLTEIQSYICKNLKNHG